jgi:hypothetical protein
MLASSDPQPGVSSERKQDAQTTKARTASPQQSAANLNKKLALAGGGYCVYAPRFPRYSHAPGFCDEACIGNAVVPSVFFLSFVENRRSVTLQLRSVVQAQGKATLTFEDANGLKVVERRFVTQDDRFVSELEVTNGGKSDREVTVVLWTTTDPEGEPVSLEGDSFRIRRLLKTGDAPEVPADIHYSSPDSKGARCLQGFFAEGGSDRPEFDETPWFELPVLPTPRAKRPMEKPSPIVAGSRVYCGLFRPLVLKAGAKVWHRFEANVVFKGKGLNFRARRPDPKDENGWQTFWDKVPRFHCDNKEIERVVRHRFELLYLLRQPHGAGQFSSASVCEGTGPFHQPSSFSTPAIMREARWLQDPTLARGCLKVFFENVHHNGQVPGRVYLGGTNPADFYHADWGGGFEALDAVHPDKATKKAVLMAMQRYVKWLANNRDPEGSGLTDIVNHFEAGQEFSRRYMVIDTKADRAIEFTEQFRLKGIDASVFRYRMVKWLHKVAEEIQEKAMANRFHAEAEVILDMIRRKMWDEKAGMFMDLDPDNRRKTNVKAAVGFYPLATDIPNQKQVDRMLDTLSDRNEFWTKFPVPSIAVSDSTFDAAGRWKGTRKGCPWNGRVWPVVNTHILEGLTHWAERGNKRAQKLAVELLKKFVSMLSGQADGSNEANSLEHYHPESGVGSRYRGVDQYLNAFVLDNIFRIACGFAIRYGEVQDDPIGEAIDFKMTGMPLGNKLYDIDRKNGRLRVQQQ